MKMELVYDSRRFQELTNDEMMEIDGGFIMTLIVAAGYAVVKIGGITVVKFVGAAAVSAAIAWCVNRGLDYVFG